MPGDYHPPRFPRRVPGYPLEVSQTRPPIESDQDDPRSEEQKVAAGEAPETPVAVFLSVFSVIAILVVVALVVAGLAYWLA